MAKPRVFVSSTYYDLKHLRSSLESFIESLGFEPILSERGDIPYSPDAPLDDSCYREAANADIFVLIIGGRYGSEASGEEKKPHTFFEQYDSITKQEFRRAVERDVPTYILVEANVYAEYRTFLNNKDNQKIRYAHVDSMNVFLLIEGVLSLPKNNPVFPFNRYSEIEGWLREQWAGIFKELLGRTSGQQQIASLSEKVAELGEINLTLKGYLESIIEKVSPKDSRAIIENEAKRLEEAQQLAKLKDNRWVDWVCRMQEFPFDACVSALKLSHGFEALAKDLARAAGRDLEDKAVQRVHRTTLETQAAREDVNHAREVLGLPPFAELSAGAAVAP